MQKQYPLTPIQQGMLLHTVMSPYSGVDVYQVIIDFHEELNVEAFIGVGEVHGAIKLELKGESMRKKLNFLTDTDHSS